MNRSTSSSALPWLALLYALASLLHFVHNAEYLDDYPNLPAWISRSSVYLTWLGIGVIGLVGFLLVRRGWQRCGLAVLAVFAVLGFDGLLHYTRAPFASHTVTMNLTILFEAAAAALLLSAVVRHALHVSRLERES